MSYGWGWVAGAVFASLVCGVGAQAGIDVREPFPNELLSEHIALIVVPLSITGLAICGAVLVACARTLKLALLLVLGMWLALLSVGIVSWYVTYDTSRQLLIERAEQTLSITAQQAKAATISEIGTGVDTVMQVQGLAVSGKLDMLALWPESHVFFHTILHTVARHTQSIATLMVGTEDGRFQGMYPRSDVVDGVTVDTHYTKTLPSDDINTLPPWMLCRARDWGPKDCTVEATPAACANTSSHASVYCSKSCGFPDLSKVNCRGQLGSLETIAAGSNASAGPDARRVSIFESTPQVALWHLPFDPRVRPWYTRASELKYSFYFQVDGKAALAVSAGITTASGQFLGTAGANLRLDLVSQFLRDLRPTANSVVFLLATDMGLVGSSFTQLELMEDSGMTRPSTFEAANVKNYNNSDSLIMKGVRALLSKWGTVARATTQSALFPYEGDFVVTYPVDLPQFDTVLVINVPISDVMEEADHASTISLVMTVCISVGLALLGAGGLTLALRPLNQLQEDMYSVACMQLDGHDHTAASHLSEVRSMQESFRVMVSNLIEYKQYLPQSVLQDSDDSDVSVTKSSSKTTRESASVMTSVVEVQARFAESGACRVRSVSLVVTNLSGFIRMSKVVSNGELVHIHASYLEVVLGLVKGNRGMLDEFIGDKVHVSFNSLTNCSGHRSAATAFLLESTNFAFEENTTRDESLQLNGAAVSMKAVCGNFGCKGLKKFSIVGAAGARVWILERWSKAWGVKGLVDDNIAQEIHVDFSLRRIAKVRSVDKHEDYVYEVLGAKEVEQAEWMYQMEDSTSGNPLSECNNAMDLLYKGKFAEARALLKPYVSENISYVISLLDWIRECDVANEPPVPIPIVSVPDKKRAFKSDDYALVPSL
eukprot:TRINITY_DN3865_c0_g1_i3.p1 TRINITY_DN3865_c0_g1~~TRINITY_DN3865_c0_g1_i3.p1  ORF type:complete len:885 (+),score=190.27 TRINITY_DN3865_c0_g1_i3:81-2735(+)